MPKTFTGPRIEIHIDTKGNPTTKVVGVSGAVCHAITAPYEAMYGEVLDSHATTEAFEKPEEVEIKAKQHN